MLQAAEGELQSLRAAHDALRDADSARRVSVAFPIYVQWIQGGLECTHLWDMMHVEADRPFGAWYASVRGGGVCVSVMESLWSYMR